MNCPGARLSKSDFSLWIMTAFSYRDYLHAFSSHGGDIVTPRTTVFLENISELYNFSMWHFPEILLKLFLKVNIEYLAQQLM